MTVRIFLSASPAVVILKTPSKKCTQIKDTLENRRDFLNMNKIADGIMKKDTTTSKGWCHNSAPE
jgi:hypothetical protein